MSWPEKDAEVHLHALQPMTEQFQLSKGKHCHLGKKKVWIMGCT
jgi:hypothetical protein